jgi:hypothetical protein
VEVEVNPDNKLGTRYETSCVDFGLCVSFFVAYYTLLSDHQGAREGEARERVEWRRTIGWKKEGKAYPGADLRNQLEL